MSSILKDAMTALSSLNVPMQTGAFKGEAPDTYLVLIPLTDLFSFHADDAPQAEKQELRISIYSKTSYTTLKNNIVSALLSAGFTISAMKYIEYENDTGYYHYNIDTEKNYEWE